jgi:DNA excision repair protein ERCC-2
MSRSLADSAEGAQRSCSAREDKTTRDCMSMNSTEAGGLFPYDRARQGQKDFLADAREALGASLALAAHAPTGLGKTAVGLTAALESREDGAVVYMTARQSQHMAVVDTMRLIVRRMPLRCVDIVALEDMCLAAKKDAGPPCHRGESCYFLDQDRIAGAAKRLLQYPLHAQEAMRACLRSGACPYHAAMRAAVEADLVVCDYNQLFSLDGDDILERAGRKAADSVAVVDEAHNLPQRIRDAGSADLDAKTLMQQSRFLRSRRFRRELEGLGGLAQGAERGAIDRFWLNDHVLEMSDRPLEELARAMERHAAVTADAGLMRTALSLIAWGRFGEESVRYSDGYGGLHCRFISPGLVAAPVIDGLRACLLMSGTLYPPQHFAEVLGIADRCGCRTYPSPFPRENRLVLAVGGVTTRYDRRSPGMFGNMASRIEEACGQIPGNVAAFFPSYEMMRSVGEYLPASVAGKRQIVERREYGKYEREAILADLRSGTDALLIAPISGSLAEGIDFSDNLLSAVIVAGIPYAPPSPEADEMLSRLEKRVGRQEAMLRVSVYPAMTKVLQAAGRAIRSETDRAAILLMDDRYANGGIRRALPADVAIARSSCLSDELGSFFSAIVDAPVGVSPEEVNVS